MNHDRLLVVYIIVFSLLLILLPGCAVEKGTVYEKDGKLYGKHEGLFKSKWYNY